MFADASTLVETRGKCGVIIFFGIIEFTGLRNFSYGLQIMKDKTARSS